MWNWTQEPDFHHCCTKKLHWNTLRHTWDTVILLKTAYINHFEHFLKIEIFEKTKFYCIPLWICLKLIKTTWLSAMLSKNVHGNTLRHTWDTVILLKTAYFKHFEHFPDIEKFEKLNFAANHSEYVWNWSQQPDFHHCWAKKLHGNTLRHTWDTVILLKIACFKHFVHFPGIEKFEKLNFSANHSEYVWNWLQQPDFHNCWAKNCVGIPWGIPEIQWFCLKQLKTTYFKHFENFPPIERFKKANFAAKNCECVWNWSQQPDFHHCWAKNCMGIPWGISEIEWFCLKQHILNILSIFRYWNFWKIIFCCKPLWICVKLVTTTWLSPLLSKKLHGNTLRHTWDTVILLKTA